MADTTFGKYNVLMKLVDNGDGTYSYGTAGNLNGGSTATQIYGGSSTQVIYALPDNVDNVTATALACRLGVQARNTVFNGSTWDRQYGDTGGALNQPYALSSSRWQFAGATGGITDTSDVALQAAAGAGVRNYLCAIQYSNSSATASEIVVKDGSTVIWRGYVPATTGSGAVVFGTPLRGTANTALNVAMITTGTATRVSAQGYKGA